MLLSSVGWANSYYQEEGDYTDEWDVVWRSVEYRTRFGSGRYTEIAGHPLAEEAAVDRYRPPDPMRPELYEEARRVVESFGSEYWIVGVTVTTIFETAWALRGLDRLLMDFALNPELAERILDIPFHYRLAQAGGENVYNRLFSELPEKPSGVMVPPHFCPKGPPEFIAHSTGVFNGLKLETTRGEILKGILQGVVFSLRECVELLPGTGIKIEDYRAIGGGSKSDDWIQLYADILD